MLRVGKPHTRNVTRSAYVDTPSQLICLVGALGRSLHISEAARLSAAPDEVLKPSQVEVRSLINSETSVNTDEYFNSVN